MNEGMVQQIRKANNSPTVKCVRVCSPIYRLSQKRGEKKHIEVGWGKQLSFCYTDPRFKSLSKCVMVSVVVRGCREQCLAAFEIPGCNLVQSPGTLIFPSLLPLFVHR